MNNKRTVVSISLPKQTAQDVEKARKNLGLTRSEFFRMLTRKHLGQEAEDFSYSWRNFFKAAQEHAGSGDPDDLSERHDEYLY